MSWLPSVIVIIVIACFFIWNIQSKYTWRKIIEKEKEYELKVREYHDMTE